MTVKEWLMRAWKMDKEINQLLATKQEAYGRATGTTASTEGERVQTSNGNSSEKNFISYAEYSAMIDKRVDELYAVKQEILSAIGQVQDSTLRTLLIARYINFKTWERIAVEMNYSYMHVCRLHGNVCFLLA